MDFKITDIPEGAAYYGPDQHTALAKKLVSDQDLEASFHDETFREFCRCMLLQTYSAFLTKIPGKFGYFFMMSDQQGNKVEIEFEVKSKVIERGR